MVLVGEMSSHGPDGFYITADSEMEIHVWDGGGAGYDLSLFGTVYRVGDAIEICSRCFVVCGDFVGTFLLPGSLLT